MGGGRTSWDSKRMKYLDSKTARMWGLWKRQVAVTKDMLIYLSPQKMQDFL